MTQQDKLAIDGGTPARPRPGPPNFYGGMLIDTEEEQAVLEVLRTKRLFRYYGPQEGPSRAEELERRFAATMGSRHALAVSSGTGALVCGLQGIGVGPGDEVIVPAFTWISSPASVVAVGAVPVVAEVDESLTLDPADVEAKITPYTKAIMPVHMRGTPARMDQLLDVARRHGLKVIEDTAQADGASFGGQRLGTFGNVGCFSLQFNKILTAGEGGMVITDDDDVYRRALLYHDVAAGNRQGMDPALVVWGINFRMPELLAAVMLVQLRRLDGMLEAMRQRKRMLIAGIEDVLRERGATLQDVPDPQGDASVALVFFVDSVERTRRVAEALRAENIGVWELYRPERVDYHVYAHWIPIMNQRTWTAEGGPWRWAHREIRYSQDMCPRSLDLLGRAVHIDVNPLQTNQDIEETIEGITKVLRAL